MRMPAEDPSPARWLAERMLEPWSGAGGGMLVGAIVPTGFEAYARVFPIAYQFPSGNKFRWAEVAAMNGRIAHPLMEWHLISTPAPGSGRPPWTEGGAPVPPSDEELRELAAVLGEFTRTPDRCWYCVWTGFGGIEETESGARVRHRSHDRSYLLSSGPIEAVTSFEIDGPNIWWPDDRAWCVASDIDLAATYVGGSASCIDGLLGAERLEALRVSQDDRVDINADVLNEA